uniref:Uncharacterized protein n=1 Tax=Arundo donax TaxID=35708 RepID=A0A0A9FUJ3_ARUDO
MRGKSRTPSNASLLAAKLQVHAS